MFRNNRAEIRRLLRQIDKFEERIAALEDDLREERETSRRMVLELTNRVLTAAGCYALPKDLSDKPHPKVETRSQSTQLNAVEVATREAYREEAKRLGKSQREADEMFEKQRRGELVYPDAEEEFVIPN